MSDVGGKPTLRRHRWMSVSDPNRDTPLLSYYSDPDELSDMYCSAARNSLISRMALSKSSRRAKSLEKSANETQLGDSRCNASRLIAGETASLYSADVQIREPQMDGDRDIGLRHQEFVK
jgi:hypothetical protein